MKALLIGLLLISSCSHKLLRIPKEDFETRSCYSVNWVKFDPYHETPYMNHRKDTLGIMMSEIIWVFREDNNDTGYKVVFKNNVFSWDDMNGVTGGQIRYNEITRRIDVYRLDPYLRLDKSIPMDQLVCYD